MGWWGHGIYDGDDTQTCHYDFLKWAKIGKNEDDRYSYLAEKGTFLPAAEREKFIQFLPIVIEKLDKKIKRKNWDEDDALEWQMLVALLVDNSIPIPQYVFAKFEKAHDILTGSHAQDFNSPRKRLNVLNNLMEKATELLDKKTKMDLKTKKKYSLSDSDVEAFANKISDKLKKRFSQSGEYNSSHIESVRQSIISQLKKY